MRFLQLHIENWRNFRTLSLPLQRRVFVIGPNASGKSNLLDVFRFLAEVAQTGRGLQYAINKRQGLSKIRCLAARRYPDVVFDVQIGDDPETPEWRYRLDLNQDNQRRAIIRAEAVYHRGEQVLARPDVEDKRDPERLTQTLLEQVSANKNFRDIADFLASVRYLHIVPQLVRDPERSIGRSGDPYGGDFLEQIARTPQKTLDSRLARITKVLQVAVPQLQELRLERDVRGVPHLSGLYEHWRQMRVGSARTSSPTARSVSSAYFGLFWKALVRSCSRNRSYPCTRR